MDFMVQAVSTTCLIFENPGGKGLRIADLFRARKVRLTPPPKSSPQLELRPFQAASNAASGKQKPIIPVDVGEPASDAVGIVLVCRAVGAGEASAP